MITQEEREAILKRVEPCTLFWDMFYVTDDGKVFTSNEETGESAEEVYKNWLYLKENPPAPVPTTKEQIEDLQKQIKVKDAQIQVLSEQNEFNEDLIAELAMVVYN